jgi:hypothetical protein
MFFVMDNKAMAAVDWDYNNETKTLTIIGSGAIPDYEGIESAPWSKHREEIKAVVVENGITSIGRFAFAGLTKCESVKLPKSVETIKYNAFYSCVQLSELVIYDTIVEMDKNIGLHLDNLKQITWCYTKDVEITESKDYIQSFLAEDGVKVTNNSDNYILVNGIKIVPGDKFPHVHSYVGDYEITVDNHYKYCSCGEKSAMLAHEMELVEKTDTFEKHRCKECGHEIKEEIPAKIVTAIGAANDKYATLRMAMLVVIVVCVIGVLVTVKLKADHRSRRTRRRG